LAVKALLVYPEMPPTFWSMRYALPFLGRKAALPPLGLITVAAMLPLAWELRLIDLNVESLSSSDVEAVDVVFVSAMIVQRPSFERVIKRCNAAGKPVVAGGPYPTSCHEQIEGVDHFVLGEAEVNLPPFLEDFAQGRAKACYFDSTRPDLALTPPPRIDLVDRRRYAGAALQFSRGCPHHCEFCDIVELFGHRPRTKRPDQFLAEMDLLYDHGWRGSLFVVDDNFIGNRLEVRRLLPELARWQQQRGYPFTLYTEASLDLASDEPLMDHMVEAGFNMVFLGIETPDRATLESVGKRQNTRSDILASVEAIQRKGMEVSSGFIVGFDGDREDIFDRQIRFIQQAAIPTAMVGMLTALPNTRLHARLSEEGRLLDHSGGGNNTHDLELNFRPRMDAGLLRRGYKRVLAEIYTPRNYFARCLALLCRMKRQKASVRKVGRSELRAFGYSLIRQSFSRYSFSYWSYLLRALILRPLMAAEIVTLAVKGHHFFTMTRGLLEEERFREKLTLARLDLEARLKRIHQGNLKHRAAWEAHRAKLVAKARARFHRLHPDFRVGAAKALEDFRTTVDLLLA
jgi:radical SAM superfamily enzyme YgiQ (UPF0313 family)